MIHVAGWGFGHMITIDTFRKLESLTASIHFGSTQPIISPRRPPSPTLAYAIYVSYAEEI
jgi:hypothetical protein